MPVAWWPLLIGGRLTPVSEQASPMGQVELFELSRDLKNPLQLTTDD
jgi:hypothetical protein